MRLGSCRDPRGAEGGLLWLCAIPDAVGLVARAGSAPKAVLTAPFPPLPDNYYRVNLRTKRVDLVQPRYPRSIAQYWLDCPQPGEEST